MAELQQQIEKVEANIKAVEQQIQELEPQIAAEIASGGPLLQYLIRKEEQLWEEELLLRKEKEQLREEELLLLNSKGTAKLPDQVASSPSLDAIFANWKSKHGDFITKFLQQEGLNVKPEWEVPVRLDGRPSILFHRLQDKWSKGSDAWKLLEYMTLNKRPGCIPLMGVSGCGKTRTLYEILATRWGFFFTASTKRNGGSLDMVLVGVAAGGSDPNCEKHFAAVVEMKKLVLARLLILQYVRSMKPDLTPEQWLILQTEFRHFCGDDEDPYRGLAEMLITNYEFKEDDLTGLWGIVRSELSCKPVFVMDEFQTLNGLQQFQSPQSGKLRARFSPVMKALLDHNFHVAVFVSGTGIRFLELEDDNLPNYVIKFDRWEKPGDVYEFCQNYVPVLGLSSRNCALLFDKFKGRKRCLVTCLEELLLNGCCWSEDTVDLFYADLTTRTSRDFISSLYAVVGKRKGRRHSGSRDGICLPESW